MKDIKKSISMILAVVMLVSVVPFGTGTVKAASYNASAAITYANSHWNDGVGLCAEFVSRCLAAGGVSIPNKSYYSSSKQSYENNSGTLEGYTNPYKCSAALLLYLSENYTIITNPSIADISLGDVVFMYGGSSGQWRDGHVGIVINEDAGAPIYAAHNKATNSGKFSSNYPCTYVAKMNGSSSLKESTKFPTPIKAYTLATGKTTVYSSIGGSAKVNKIYDTDRCTINAIYENGWCKVTFPLDAGGTETGYVKTAVFFNPDYDTFNATASKKTVVYTRSDLSTEIGSIAADTKLQVVGHTSKAVQVLYPRTSGGYGVAWVPISVFTYGEYAGHQLTNHPRNEANHSKAGNIEYWTCDICNKYFNDAAGNSEIRQEDTVINKISHSFNTEWSNNSTHHWKECTCGEQAELAKHQFDNECDTTCNAGCGYTRTITHQWKSVYSADDNKHWYECEICGEKKDEGNHSGGTANCKDKAVCEVCDKAYGELAPHDMKEEVDDTYLKAEANCVEKAVYYKSCSVCGTASTETFKTGELDSTIHTGKTDVKDDVKETCTVDGYSGDVYCKDCGAKIKEGEVIPAGHSYDTTYKTDVVNHWKECGCGDTVEKATHTFTEWTVTKEASATEKGSKERACSVCQYNEVEELPIKETNSPQTGDYRTLYLWIALIVVSFVSVVGTIHKRKRI